MRPTNHDIPWSLIERLVVYELYCRHDRKSLATGDIDVIATAQDLLRSTGSVTARIGNYSTLFHDHLSHRINRLFNGNWMLVARILSNVGYSPRISFMATQSAVSYLSQFPASAAHTLIGGYPTKQGFTPTIDIKSLIKNINACASEGLHKFDAESLLTDIDYIFVTSSDDGKRIKHVYEDATNYADQSNLANHIQDGINELI